MPGAFWMEGGREGGKWGKVEFSFHVTMRRSSLYFIFLCVIGNGKRRREEREGKITEGKARRESERERKRDLVRAFVCTSKNEYGGRRICLKDHFVVR